MLTQQALGWLSHLLIPELHILTSSLVLKMLFIFILCVWLLYLDIWNAYGSQRGMESPGVWIFDGCELPCGCGGLKLGPLKRQHISLTPVPFLQSPLLYSDEIASYANSYSHRPLKRLLFPQLDSIQRGRDLGASVPNEMSSSNLPPQGSSTQKIMDRGRWTPGKLPSRCSRTDTHVNTQAVWWHIRPAWVQTRWGPST